MGRTPPEGFERAINREEDNSDDIWEGTRPDAINEAATKKGFLLANLGDPMRRSNSKLMPVGPDEERRGHVANELKNPS
jgi:hypothetical protein